MRIFKNKEFAKFAKKEGISDAKLYKAVKDVEAGKIDANYGGGVIKQRIARRNEGKSGGYRSVILYRRGHRAFFVYGFAKSERENIDRADEQIFKESAKVILAFSDDEITKLLKAG
ncbi:MAG TPA: type II toxin-antitoxin system RelE/ParE family toxin, partial [Ktedonobacteraceae bacterium]|nr:type II toxin-antitoxin system RelE/ParE family toxin [Ktedonobacteraceae bacterium]